MDAEHPTLHPHGDSEAIAARARAALARMDEALAALRQQRTFGEAGPSPASTPTVRPADERR
jgi:hypothetical protein